MELGQDGGATVQPAAGLAVELAQLGARVQKLEEQKNSVAATGSAGGALFTGNPLSRLAGGEPGTTFSPECTIVTCVSGSTFKDTNE